MSHDEFTKLFTYMEKKFGAIDKRFDKVEGGIRDLKFNMAELSDRAENYRQEVLVIKYNDSRQNRRIKELADYTGAKLSSA